MYSWYINFSYDNHYADTRVLYYKFMINFEILMGPRKELPLYWNTHIASVELFCFYFPLSHFKVKDNREYCKAVTLDK